MQHFALYEGSHHEDLPKLMCPGELSCLDCDPILWPLRVPPGIDPEHYRRCAGHFVAIFECDTCHRVVNVAYGFEDDGRPAILEDDLPRD